MDTTATLELPLTDAASTSPEVSSFADIEAIARRCDILTVSRSLGSTETAKVVDIYVDDIKADVRMVFSFRLDRQSGECRFLHGYNKEKNAWARYGRAVLFHDISRRGGKALLAFLAAKAVECKGYPNPEHFTWFKARAT
jgi:hypothetical protein